MTGVNVGFTIGCLDVGFTDGSRVLGALVVLPEGAKVGLSVVGDEVEGLIVLVAVTVNLSEIE